MAQQGLRVFEGEVNCDGCRLGERLTVTVESLSASHTVETRAVELNGRFQLLDFPDGAVRLTVRRESGEILSQTLGQAGPHEPSTTVWVRAETKVKTGAMVSAARVTHRPAKAALRWAEKGVALNLRQEYAKAAQALERAVEADAGYFDAWLQLGMAYARLQRWTDAEAAYEMAAKVDAQDVMLLRERGWLRLMTNNAKQAEILGNQALRQWPQDVRSHCVVALARVQMGLLDGATLEHLEIAKDMSPLARWHLAQLEYKTGRSDAARAELAVLKASRDPRWRETAAKALDSMGQ